LYVGTKGPPARNDTDNPEQYELAKARWNSHHERSKADKKTEDWIFGKLREAWNAQRPKAIRCIVAIPLNNANVPWPATYGHRVYFDNSNRLLLVEYNLPDIHKLSFNWSLGSGTQAQLNLKEQLLIVGPCDFYSIWLLLLRRHT